MNKKIITAMVKAIKISSLVVTLFFTITASAETYSCKNQGCFYPDITLMMSINGNVISLQEEGRATPFTYRRKDSTQDVYWRFTNGRYSNRIYLVLGRGAFRYHENATVTSAEVDQIYKKKQICQ